MEKRRTRFFYFHQKLFKLQIHYKNSCAHVAETHSLSHSQGHSLTSLCWHKMHKKCMYHKNEASHLDLSPSSLPCHWAMPTTLISAVSLMCTHVTASIRASGICTAFSSAGSRSSSSTNRKVCHFEVLWHICLWGLLFLVPQLFSSTLVVGLTADDKAVWLGLCFINVERLTDWQQQWGQGLGQTHMDQR